MAGGIHHIAVTVSDVASAEAAFYAPLLESLGFVKQAPSGPLSVWRDDMADLRVHIFGVDEPAVKKPADAREPVDHVALRVTTRSELDALHEKLAGVGADVVAAPAEIPQFGAGYYAMFVRDPDGRLVEIVHVP